MSKKSSDTLHILHARENNLKNLSLDIAHDTLTTVTGLSGSGKSSLAFDTVYAEGQRRYIETFSPYTRQFFDKVKKPSVDSITNVRPAIAIQQRTRITSSRSTVGSLTNINDYLKVLWANVSTPSCPHCKKPLIAWSPELLSKELPNLLENYDSLLITAPIATSPEAFTYEMDRFQTLGFARVFDPALQSIVSIEEVKKTKNPLYLVIERLRGEVKNSPQLLDSLDQAFSIGNGICSIVQVKDSKSTITDFHKDFYCKTHSWSIVRPKQSFFSYNHPLGACSTCSGFGFVLEVTEATCVPDIGRSIQEKAIQPWASDSFSWEYKQLIKFCEKNKIRTDIPWRALPEEAKEKIFHLDTKEYCGVMPWFKWLETKTYKMHVRVFLSKYRKQKLCPDCQGSRIKSQGLSFLIDGKTIADIWQLPISELHDWLEAVEAKIKKSPEFHRNLKDVFGNLKARLEYLISLGLPYLTLERQARTLSGGETQRVNLATALGSELVSTHFILDEPSVGLHPRDTDRLIDAVKGLTKKGNSLLVVEHDPDFILAGDDVIELGPQAGKQGGEIVFNGPTLKWKGLDIPTAPNKPPRTFPQKIQLKGASGRNLQNLSVTIPLNAFVVLSGVSGSGKSTLVHEVLAKGFKVWQQKEPHPNTYKSITGFEYISDISVVDQSPLARSPRANIATYTKIWDEVRNLLAQTEAAASRGLTKSSFSFNVDAGRCTHCEGAGFIREDMQFLSDVYLPCEVCLGNRFQQKILQVTYSGKNVAELLNVTIDEVPSYFPKNDSLKETASILSKLGLGHLTLGHSLSELSGGEAQRLKLVPYLQRASHEKVLFIFDEPTTGLHVQDIVKLLDIFTVLVKRGHSVLCIEHNLTVIAAADWIIDLGPEGGEQGGKLIAQGNRDDLVKSTGHTARYLKKYLDEQAGKRIVVKEKGRAERISPTALVIKEAKEHNLKNIDLSVPLNKVIAITGVSGSGKSTITKDIIYAEGQRRYLDCLSPYARQYIKELKKPDIKEIHNVPPTICVYQHTFQPSSLSTVGTLSEAYTFLRLLFAKTGVQHCPDHPEYPITSQSPEDMVKTLKSINEPQVRLLAPVILHKKGTHKAIFEKAIKEEISEVRVDGVFGKPSQFIDELKKSKSHVIEYVVAKCNPKNVDDEILLETITQTLSLGNGAATVMAKDREFVMSTERACPVCHRGFFKPDPEDFSFHSKRGACTKCHGTGVDAKEQICESCNGLRLAPVGLSVKIDGKTIVEYASLASSALLKTLKATPLARIELAQSILDELYAKLEALNGLGLSYLPLSRDCATLSGGELQRLRLAAAFGSPLSGVMYILDEPSAGLHPIDNRKVLSRIEKLRSAGNSVLIIEHDIESIKSCEHIIDVGPGAGSHGGEILFNGKIDHFISTSNSHTAHALRDDQSFTVETSPLLPIGKLTVKNARGNNLKGVDVTFPLGQLSIICGVSGAGKSSLVHGAMIETIEDSKDPVKRWQSEKATITSDLEVHKVIFIDQKPIGNNSRSTPASYLEIWDHIRKVFAQTLEAKSRGWTQSFFSYNSGKGRCQSCKGLGIIRLEMNFLAQAEVPCEVCSGSRYSDQAKTVKYLGHSIDQVLGLTFEEAKSLFAQHRQIHDTLRFACEIGLGYLTLGQPSSTLSGGESQRIKLVSELSKPPKKHSLYVLDEPTIGLHRVDVARLTKSLQQLCASGSTVLVIEHDIDMIRSADFVVELGPGPGAHGGEIIAKGTPEEIACGNSIWGNLLKESKSCNERAA